ncbi:uncharacterized protein [Antedon mediterranea]|uniref:uncharacterized protein n=1 Tax=Antedon mediterranea TaxID=105859 RepID=UPI003AF44D71
MHNETLVRPDSPFLKSRPHDKRPKLRFNNPKQTEEWLSSKEKTDYTYSKSASYSASKAEASLAVITNNYPTPIMSRRSHGVIYNDSNGASTARRSKRLASKQMPLESYDNLNEYSESITSTTTSIYSQDTHNSYDYTDMSDCSTAISSNIRGRLFPSSEQYSEKRLDHLYGLDRDEISDTESTSAIYSRSSSFSSNLRSLDHSASNMVMRLLNVVFSVISVIILTTSKIVSTVIIHPTKSLAKSIVTQSSSEQTDIKTQIVSSLSKILQIFTSSTSYYKEDRRQKKRKAFGTLCCWLVLLLALLGSVMLLGSYFLISSHEETEVDSSIHNIDKTLDKMMSNLQNEKTSDKVLTERIVEEKVIAVHEIQALISTQVQKEIAAVNNVLLAQQNKLKLQEVVISDLQDRITKLEEGQTKSETNIITLMNIHETNMQKREVNLEALPNATATDNGRIAALHGNVSKLSNIVNQMQTTINQHNITVFNLQNNKLSQLENKLEILDEEVKTYQKDITGTVQIIQEKLISTTSEMSGLKSYVSDLQDSNLNPQQETVISERVSKEINQLKSDIVEIRNQLYIPGTSKWIDVNLLNERVKALDSQVETIQQDLVMLSATSNVAKQSSNPDTTGLLKLQEDIVLLNTILGVSPGKKDSTLITLQKRLAILEESITGDEANTQFALDLSKATGDVVLLKSGIDRLTTSVKALESGVTVADLENIRTDVTHLNTVFEQLQFDLIKCCKNASAMAALFMSDESGGVLDFLMSRFVGRDELDLANEKLSTSSLNTTANLNLQEIRNIVNDLMLINNADKTGMVDFALESAGGSIISTRCSKTYSSKTALLSIFGIPLWYDASNPRMVIQPDVNPGNCWAFAGTRGFIVIQLSGLVKITSFSMEHIPRSLSATGNIDSAPNNFSVIGLEHEYDSEGTQLGNYAYDKNGRPIQFFAIQKPNLQPFRIVELRINNNHGNPDYTCLYRFRVHGILEK